MERSRDWVVQAKSDLETAGSLLDQGRSDWASFAAQQSAEKAVEAVLQRLHAEAWGHAVSKLLEALRDHHPVPDDLIDAAKELDEAYVGARYPNVHPAGAPTEQYTRARAERLVAHARAVVGYCEQLLTGEA